MILMLILIIVYLFLNQEDPHFFFWFFSDMLEDSFAVNIGFLYCYCLDFFWESSSALLSIFGKFVNY